MKLTIKTAIVIIVIIAIPVTAIILTLPRETGDYATSHTLNIDEETGSVFVQYDFYSGLDRIYTHLNYVGYPNVDIVLGHWLSDTWLDDDQLKIWLSYNESLYLKNGSSIIIYGLLSTKTSYGFIFKQNGIWRYFVVIPLVENETILRYCKENSD